MAKPEGSMYVLIGMLVLAGCDQIESLNPLNTLTPEDVGAPPPPLQGLWQVHQVETSTRPIDADEVALEYFPGCIWARQTWNFERDRIRVEHDALCAATREEEYSACRVAAEAPAEWDQDTDTWKIGTTIKARSRAIGLDGAGFSMPGSCTVQIDAGRYQIAKMPPREAWSWEMAVPNGTVLRLRIPDSDDPRLRHGHRQETQRGEFAMIVSLLVCGLAHAQELPDDEAPPPAERSPRHIILPDPYDELEKEQGSTTGSRSATDRSRLPARKPSVPPRITRDTPRPVRGDAPADLWGRYHVVEVTNAGITEDFANKMERAGRALNEDCIVVRQVFDFGPQPEAEGAGHRPREVELIQIRECDVGGLGNYAEETSMIIPARWTEGAGSVTLTLPEAAVVSHFIRVSPPRDMDTRPQWLAPESRVQRGATSYAVIAEPSRRGALPVLHLTSSDQVFHLEADPGDSSFDEALRAMAEAQP